MACTKKNLFCLICVLTAVVTILLVWQNGVVYSGFFIYTHSRPKLKSANGNLLNLSKPNPISGNPKIRSSTSNTTQSSRILNLKEMKLHTKSTSDRRNISLISLNILKFEKKAHNFEKAIITVHTKKIVIFIHDKTDYVSRAILTDGLWETKWVYDLLYFLKELKSEVQFMDIGCNIGVYTLAIASFGYNVIAVDANKNNTDRLVQAVIYNHLEKKTTIILNAISNIRKNFSMNTIQGNVGGQKIINDKTAPYQVSSIFLDDLLMVTDQNKKVVMKIDIEGSEIYLIKKASNLFAKRNIVAVMMEWAIVKLNQDCVKIISFFTAGNFRPYQDFHTQNELGEFKYSFWPDEIVWRKKQ